MSKPRVTTDEQCKALADWFGQMRSYGTVQSKARELGISVSALYDAIARGNKMPTAGARFKVASYVSHETNQSESNDGEESAA